MELKEFVETTLVQIAEGIAAANEQLQGGNTGAIINPAESLRRSPKEVVRPVDFDVALTVSEENVSKETTKAGGKLGILSVVSLAASADSEDAGTNRREAI